MARRRIAIVLFALAAGANVLHAQTQAGTPTLPDTPAGRVLRAWLDAFNSGDSARVDAYIKQYQPDLPVQGQLNFRNDVGGFDLVSVERSEPLRLEYVLKERKGPRTAYGFMMLSETEPRRVVDDALMSLGPNGTAAAASIDATTRARVIDSAAAKLDEFYVFPDVAKRMGDSMRARRARGAYDMENNGISFALRLHRELREISHDKHLSVRYSMRALPPQPASPQPPTPEDRERMRAQMDAMNCGFVKVEQLEGNVGYVKFNMFADPETCGPTASAAMNFIAGTRALIVDMRDNGGGAPAMVAYVTSYLFSQRTHLNDLWNRKTGKTEEFWTRDSIPGRRFGGEKPIYVLTSSHTFSGAEEFSYNLKSLKRATIVGETTGGGAHPVSGRRIDEHFMIGVPGARAINPITKTNWEGVGVEPDIKVPAAEALATAQRLLKEKAKP